jgi:hypothetical protein
MRPPLFTAVVLAVTASVSLGTAPASAHGTHMVILGPRGSGASGTKGYGHAHPKIIYNGGDPSGDIQHIRWKHWGSATSTGRGKTSVFKPHGGYYTTPALVELRASHVEHCVDGGGWAYTLLKAREPKKPGGRLGKWFVWSNTETLCNTGSE